MRFFFDPDLHFTTILLQGDRFVVNLCLFKTQMFFCTAFELGAFAKSQTYSHGCILVFQDKWLKNSMVT